MSVTNFVDDRQRVPTDPTSVPTDPPLSNSTFGGRVGEVQAVKRAWCLEPNKQSFLSGDFGSGWTTIVPPQKCHGPRLVQQMQLCCDKRPAAAAAAAVGVGVVVVVVVVVRSASPAMQIKYRQRYPPTGKYPTSELAPHWEAISLLGSYQD